MLRVHSQKPILLKSVDRKSQLNQKDVGSTIKDPLFIHNVNVTSSSGSSILREINLSIQRGNLLAIMGPSGSGKTSLLDAIASNYQAGLKYDGYLVTNGVLRYVPQHDLLHGFFTVKQYVSHYFDLIYGFINAKTKTKLVDKIIEKVGLTDSANVRVGDVFFKGLSGGQRKRLSIALELVGYPEILILDEPTSGLDSVSALHIISLMKKLTHDGITVICTLHQPSSEIWDLIDDILLLSKGQIIFTGPKSKAVSFFDSISIKVPNNYNPADYYLMQINTDFKKKINIEEMSQKFVQWKLKEDSGERKKGHLLTSVQSNTTHSKLYSEFEQMVSNAKGPRLLTPFYFLTKRYLMNLLMNPGVIIVRLAMYIVFCGVIGLLYKDLGSQFGFFDITKRVELLGSINGYLVFMSIAVLPFFIVEKAIIHKEISNRTFKSVHYHFSVLVSFFIGIALLSGLSTIVVQVFVGLNNPHILFLLLFLSMLCAESLALLTSLLVPHYIIGIAIVALVYGIFMICQGAIIPESEIPESIKWIHYSAFHTYVFQGLMINEFKGIEKFDNPNMPNGQAVLEHWGLKDVTLAKEVYIVLGFILGFNVLIFLLMAFIFRKRQEFKELQAKNTWILAVVSDDGQTEKHYMVVGS